MVAIFNFFIYFLSKIIRTCYINITKINFSCFGKILRYTLFICLYIWNYQKVFIIFNSDIRLFSYQGSLGNIYSKTGTRTCMAFSFRSSFRSNPNLVHSSTTIIALHLIISKEKLLLRSHINISMYYDVT